MSSIIKAKKNNSTVLYGGDIHFVMAGRKESELSKDNENRTRSKMSWIN